MNEQAKLGRSAVTFGVVLAVVGLALGAFGYMQGGQAAFAGSYLYAWVFWGSMTMGCLSMTVLFNALRGRWQAPVARIWEAAAGPSGIVLALVLMVPVFIFREQLYAAWMHAPANDILITRKNTYLNQPFWFGRIFLYFGLFYYMAARFKTWTRQEELTGDPAYGEKRNRLSGAAIVLMVLITNFFMTDIVMSLDPHWSSTMYGFIWVAGNALSATAFAVLVVIFGRKAESYKAILSDKLMTKDFGNMMLMLTMLWAYFTFSQYLIVWSGNLPEFTSYYLQRLTGNWNLFGFFQITFNFFVPLLLLFSPGVKRDPVRLGIVAAWILFFRFTDVHYAVMPFLRNEISVTAADIGCFALVGGIWLAHFGYQIAKSPLLTTAHPYLDHKEAVADAS
ncbi:MAG: hypothetical protein KF857_03590 [Fimbriimonadaceae bacterium]|nr:hypothetical protein [Fimbriimonadaceae bacterium]